MSNHAAGHLAAVPVQVRSAGGGQLARTGGAKRGHPGRTVPGAAGIAAAPDVAAGPEDAAAAGPPSGSRRRRRIAATVAASVSLRIAAAAAAAGQRPVPRHGRGRHGRRVHRLGRRAVRLSDRPPFVLSRQQFRQRQRLL